MSSPIVQQYSAPSTPVSAHIESPNSSPKRLSHLYQYHNAPEVAPVSGLEFDDSVQPYSDKYSVVHGQQYANSITQSKPLESSNQKPPFRILGMKLRTFFLVLLLVLCIIVGATVGGILGRPKSTSSTTAATSTTSSTQVQTATSTTPTGTSLTSTFSAPIPTYSILNDCPQSNNTVYISSPTTTNTTTYSYTKHCGLSSPLSGTTARTLSEAFVYSFNDCIQVCASFNSLAGAETCTAAVYVLAGQRPANCFVGAADVSTGAAAYAAASGVNVALLTSGS